MIFLLLAMVLYAVAIIFGAVASRNLNTNLAAGIINVLPAVIPLVAAIPHFTKNTIMNHKFGLAMAMCAGILIAFFTMALTKSYALNKVGVVAPVVFGGAILLSTVLSAIFLKEKITMLEGLGLAVLLVGFTIVIYARAIAK